MIVIRAYLKEVKARRLANTADVEFTTTIVSENKELAKLAMYDGDTTFKITFEEMSNEF